ncbi:MAG: hypothetical protein UY68_C0006G0029 [Parcubacteria group bacterium GW2011_GWF2_52_12]|nr:MAG: hypothetical protein UY66_C0003G0005 [Parcubacteria group bacterium GW2011_GWC1_51_35]KKW24952.1 MAG: hypothetical protein UY68_C0006G0029 [Parcubacteria group bacterium GW2011_GWF2_52_12]KKW34923.1 MAG: hypothetical protein UY80_C0003G0007 [Parcubacteria group bacterium GW2011_GWB1_53_43]KKW38718.1 MAG: hypothetical protein UY88_C0002G0005 [Parcubacteria group bacterium GW2011_GWA1_54_88]
MKRRRIRARLLAPIRRGESGLHFLYFNPGQFAAEVYPAATAAAALSNQILFSSFICPAPGQVERWYLLPFLEATTFPSFVLVEVGPAVAGPTSDGVLIVTGSALLRILFNRPNP